MKALDIKPSEDLLNICLTIRISVNVCDVMIGHLFVYVIFLSEHFQKDLFVSKFLFYDYHHHKSLLFNRLNIHKVERPFL